MVRDEELNEWLDAVGDIIDIDGVERAARIISSVAQFACKLGCDVPDFLYTDYVNTPCKSAIKPPLNFHLSKQIQGYIQWNACMMVMRANQKDSEIGGHIATFASASVLYQVGIDYFFKGPNHPSKSDLVFYQGHSAPGLYARSFIEGRLNQKHLDSFRRDVSSDHGLSAYPHPWWMPDYWQFATVSMGLGPIQGIWMAKWLAFMDDVGLDTLNDRKVWVFCGDGEMDEPESKGCLTEAANHGLGHLVFVVNCNLQRLDGPVRGNAKIVSELERVFYAAGWRVIKVLWNSAWDEVFKFDVDGAVAKYLGSLVDGAYQALSAIGPEALIEHIMKHVPSCATWLAELPSDVVSQLAPGGHDHHKVFAAYAEASINNGKPTVILAQTQKGYGLGNTIAATNTTHQQKKVSLSALKAYAQLCHVPLTDEAIAQYQYYLPESDDKALVWALKQREQWGGFIPSRSSSKYQKPDLKTLGDRLAIFQGAKATQNKLSTTMCFVKILQAILKMPELRNHIVPIVADESRTFGMEGLFRQIGIYSSVGQLYTPTDSDQLVSYVESKKGQFWQEGLNEAGALSAWIAAATSYSHSGVSALPFYIYYSMFGFQRVGDLIWAAGDMRARGFLLGAISGRTTLPGEGLQHCDGQSMVSASMVPNCVSYDPCYQYELAVIIQEGIERMMVRDEDVFYYIALTNEKDIQPAMPEGSREGIIKGMYALSGVDEPDVHILASGRMLAEAILADQLLTNHGVKVKIWSVTSYTELAREARSKQSYGFCQASEQNPSYLKQCLADGKPIIAVSDYVTAYADLIRPHVSNPFHSLGTDGFGASDSRSHLREYFGVNAHHIALNGLFLLAQGSKRFRQMYAAYLKQSNKPNNG